MKVTNTGSQPLQETASKKTDKTGKAGTAAKGLDKQIFGAEIGTSAEVELSQKAKDAKRIKEVAMKSSPDVDEAKVAKFQKLIDSGKYKVDSKAVADKLVDEQIASSGADGE